MLRKAENDSPRMTETAREEPASHLSQNPGEVIIQLHNEVGNRKDNCKGIKWLSCSDLTVEASGR